MKITYREDRILTFDKILDLEQCRKELTQAYPELTGVPWTLEFFSESDNEYFHIDTAEDYDCFIEEHDKEKTLQVKVSASSDTKELDICSISSIQQERKQQGDKEGSQFGNGPFQPIEDEGSKKAEHDYEAEKVKEKYTRSIRTQPNQARQANYEVLFTKNKERQEVVEVDDQKQVRQFHDKIDVGNEYSRSNEPKGTYSKESEAANKNQGIFKERSELKVEKSFEISKMRETNRNNKPIDPRQQEQQQQNTCSFCRKSTHHLYYLHAFHNIRLCQPCDKHYQIRSAKSIQPSPLLCNFCGTNHGAMFQVGTFDLFSCAACSRAWEISVKDQPVMGSGMKINRYE